MIQEKLNKAYKTMRICLQRGFKAVTLNFIFIFLFTTLFSTVFGAENAIVGIIIIIIMMSSMARDLTATPVKQFFIRLCILEAMTIATFLVTTLPPPLALCINFIMLVPLLYAFSFEYATNLYMPYILSYLFLIFISPVSAVMLPKRLLAMLVGAGCIIAYQLVMGRSRIKEVPKAVLTAMAEEALTCVNCLRFGKDMSDYPSPDNPKTVHQNLCTLSRLIYERRRRALCISDASFSMLECGRGLEKLILLLYSLKGAVSPARAAILEKTAAQLDSFITFLKGDSKLLIPLNAEAFKADGNEAPEAQSLLYRLQYIRGALIHMVEPKNKAIYRKTALSIPSLFKAALNISEVRVIYALRVGLILALASFAVQALQLPHGKWLLFTLAAVSLPLADDVGAKGKKRLIATLIGGALSVIAFSLIDDSTLRTVFMMFAGYMTSYFSDYKFSFACSTVGALGGAILMNAYGFTAVCSIFLIRTGYVLLGIALSYLLNRLCFPFSHHTAMEKLWKKYIATADLLLETCKSEKPDIQLYYSLIIQAYLQEEKLRELPLTPSLQADMDMDMAKKELEEAEEKVRWAYLAAV